MRRFGPVTPKTVVNTAQKLATTLFCQQKDFSYSKPSEQGWCWENRQINLSSFPVPVLPLQNAATI
jgi:hypothetical protein